MEVILLDTNILIQILKGDNKTVKTVEDIDDHIAISSISAMELYFGAFDKNETKKIEKFLSLFEVLHIDKEVSIKATKLIKQYAKSHSLDIPDSLIASCAITNKCTLLTYNLKDFRYIEALELY
jgi:predicted nucleic acid-binding protein